MLRNILQKYLTIYKALLFIYKQSTLPRNTQDQRLIVEKFCKEFVESLPLNQKIILATIVIDLYHNNIKTSREIFDFEKYIILYLDYYL